MGKKTFFIFAAVTVLLSAAVYSAKYPKPRGWVLDNAGVMDEYTKQQIETVVNSIEQKTSAEIAVVTVKSLENEPIESYSVGLFKEWGIGKQGKNNGVLILTSVDDRKMRIEVGYGLEGILPDGLVGQIIDSYMVPEFRAGNYGKGLYYGTAAVAKIIAKDAGVSLETAPLPEGRKKSKAALLFQALIFIILLIIFIRNPVLFMLFLGSGRGGSYRSGSGGFGGGGFGGFGGGFSGGGGASRGW